MGDYVEGLIPLGLCIGWGQLGNVKRQKVLQEWVLCWRLVLPPRLRPWVCIVYGSDLSHVVPLSSLCSKFPFSCQSSPGVSYSKVGILFA